MTTQEAIKYLENMKWLKGYDNTMIGDRPIASIIDDIIDRLIEQEQEIQDLQDIVTALERR